MAVYIARKLVLLPHTVATTHRSFALNFANCHPAKKTAAPHASPELRSFGMGRSITVVDYIILPACLALTGYNIFLYLRGNNNSSAGTPSSGRFLIDEKRSPSSGGAGKQ